MATPHYAFEALYFDIYRKVVEENACLDELAFDKSQLREITTSIFIAMTHRGIVRPTNGNGFVDSLVRLVQPISSREVQELIYKETKQLIEEQNLLLKEF